MKRAHITRSALCTEGQGCAAPPPVYRYVSLIASAHLAVVHMHALYVSPIHLLCNPYKSKHLAVVHARVAGVAVRDGLEQHGQLVLIGLGAILRAARRNLNTMASVGLIGVA